MAYCTVADLTTHMAVETQAMLSNDTAGATAVDTTVINGLIAHATSVIDSVVGRSYTVPLASVPAIITTICVDMVIYLLWNRRVNLTEMPKEIKAEYDKALAALDEIGNLTLPIGTTPSISSLEADIEAAERQTDWNNQDSEWSYF